MTSKTADDYTLRIRIGPDYQEDKFKIVNVNDEFHPFYLNTPHFEGYFVVRVLNFAGIVPSTQSEPIANPPSNYFNGKNRRYSIMMQGKFKQTWNGDDLLYGMEFDGPIRLPTGYQFALKIAQWLDPNMVAILDTDTPSIFSPVLCAMNAMSVYTADQLQSGLPPTQTLEEKKESKGFFKKSSKKNEEKQDTVSSLPPSLTTFPPDTIKSIGQWSFHSQLMTEDTSRMPVLEEEELPELPTYEKRKKYFSDVENRKMVQFTPEHVYCMDFYDAYIDFNSISLKLPGISVNGLRYWDGQPLRYVIKSRSGTVLFAVSFELVEKQE